MTFPIQFQPQGPCPAPFMIVGDAPDRGSKGMPMGGYAAIDFSKMLAEAGLGAFPTFHTNVLREVADDRELTGYVATTVKSRLGMAEIRGKWVSPAVRFGMDLLQDEVRLCNPTVVLAIGDLALWALTGHWGVRKWRGSVLQGEIGGVRFKVIPTLSPGAVLSEYAMRRFVVHDIKRAAGEVAKGPIVEPPAYQFIIAPTFEEVKETFLGIWDRLHDDNQAQVLLSADMETRAGHVACLGIAWSPTKAICVPFMSVKDIHYWTAEQECEILEAYHLLLTHPKSYVIWQNGSYDQQYGHRRMLFIPKLSWDTMVGQHTMYSVSKKGLDFLSSLYCDSYVYWKDDGKKWDPSIDERDYWHYNCEDCVRTLEVYAGEQMTMALLEKQGWTQIREIAEFQMKLQSAVMRMMLRGVRTDDVTRKKMRDKLTARVEEIEGEIASMVGRPLNIKSPKQMTEFFYTELNQWPNYNTKRAGSKVTKSLSADDDALGKIAMREPVLAPLVARIKALRSAGVFKSTFLDMTRDEDGRLRCSYNIAGTKTYRFSSSENAFDSGGNLQNLPTGGDDEITEIDLPNIKELFLPDDGQTWFDFDGDSADLRIVTGESGCRAMNAYFEAGVKPYVEIAKEFYRDPTITKHHPSYKRMKALCHATNYLGTPDGLSIRIGLPVADVDRMQKWYFGMCPEIKRWQDDLVAQIQKRGYIQNPFGYRCYFWERITKNTFNEGVAWIPQSTVGIFINRVLVRVDEGRENGDNCIDLLLQVHDSLNGQFPTEKKAESVAWMVDAASKIVIPCASGPIRIPVGVKTSEISWGHCK